MLQIATERIFLSIKRRPFDDIVKIRSYARRSGQVANVAIYVIDVRYRDLAHRDRDDIERKAVLLGRGKYSARVTRV